MAFYQLHIGKWIEGNGHVGCFYLVGTRQIQIINFVYVKPQIIECCIDQVEAVLDPCSVHGWYATDVMLPDNIEDIFYYLIIFR